MLNQPIETITHVLSFLDDQSQARTSQACRWFNQAYWLNRCAEIFEATPKQDPKTVYKAICAILDSSRTIEDNNQRQQAYCDANELLSSPTYYHDPWAMYYLAKLHLVTDWQYRSEETGVQYLIKASDKCYDRATRALADAYCKGNYGLTANAELAMQYYQQAINRGDHTAEILLGITLLNPSKECCIQKNVTKAVKYLHSAALAGKEFAKEQMISVFQSEALHSYAKRALVNDAIEQGDAELVKIREHWCIEHPSSALHP